MTRKEAAKILISEQGSWKRNPKLIIDKRLYDAFDVAIKILEQEPEIEDIKEEIKDLDYMVYDAKYSDAESRTDNVDCLMDEIYEILDRHNHQKDGEQDIEKESKIGQFAKWVADEIFDENWEYNKDAFAELACRKLEKLGIVRAKGDEWELVEPQESEDKS